MFTANAKKKFSPKPTRPALSLVNYEPPQAIESESALLAAMLLFPAVCELAVQQMTAADFYRPHHAALFTVLQGMAARNSPLDIVTLMAEVQSPGVAESCGGREYIAALFSIVDPYQPHAPEYARQVKDASRKRIMANHALELLEAASGNAPAEEMVAISERLITNTPLLTDQYSNTAHSLLVSLTDRMEEMATNPRAFMGLTTGLPCLDRMTNGLQAPDMIVLGARPGVGKSALMTGIASHVVRQGVPVFIASMEMSGDQVMRRMVCAEARLDSRKVMSGLLEKDELDRFHAACYPLYNAPLVINHRSGATPNYLRAEVRKFIREYGSIGLICVDYLQLMRADRKTSGRYEELSDVSMELKSVAREFNVPLLALTQISRESMKRDNKRPMLSDIRDTGQIEQDADVVMFLHRPDQFTPEGNGYVAANLSAPTVVREAELIFAKQRNGPQGVVPLQFVDQFAVFMDAESE